MSLHTYIKQLREDQSLSQEWVARSLDLTRQTYIQIESGKRDLTLGESRHLAELFDVPWEQFITEQPGSTVTVELEEEQQPDSAAQDMRISVPQARVYKFREILLYILERLGGEPHVGMTVIYKLLYFIDFDYYEKYEEQLIGARYKKNHYGPTPLAFEKITTKMIEDGDMEVVNSKYFEYDQKKYLPHRKSDLSRLTGRELQHIDEVIARLGQKNASELSEYSHQDVPWLMAEEGEELSYEAVFYRGRETTVRNYND